MNTLLWFFYNALFAAAFVLMLPKFLLRMWKRGGYREHFGERFGIYAPGLVARLGERPRVWIHAVSVGEMFVALRVLEELRRRHPDLGFAVSTTTSTGRRVAAAALRPEDVLFYYPVDVPAFVRRALDAVRPRLIVLTEGELWPNLLRLAGARAVPVAVVNGRVSDSSYRGYRFVRGLARRLLPGVRLFAVQGETDRRRLADLGADPARLRVAGTVKYDAPLADPAAADRARAVLAAAGFAAGGPVLLGGSTWPGEEDALLRIFGRLRTGMPDLRLVLVPRHAERREEVEAAIARHGLRGVRRSGLGAGAPAPAGADVLLVDTTGELRDLYACATVVFVGKTLTSTGGQNFIEPALAGRPIVVGPHTENFPDVARDFLEAAAMIQVADAARLESALGSLLRDADLRAGYGGRARALVEARRGVVARTVDLLDPLLAA